NNIKKKKTKSERDMDHKIEEQIKAKYCKHSNYILTTSETVNSYEQILHY
ncbi:11856_t:CDS:1, partial [Entrophospora sp. SA101]